MSSHSKLSIVFYRFQCDSRWGFLLTVHFYPYSCQEKLYTVCRTVVDFFFFNCWQMFIISTARVLSLTEISMWHFRVFGWVFISISSSLNAGTDENFYQLSRRLFILPTFSYNWFNFDVLLFAFLFPIPLKGWTYGGKLSWGEVYREGKFIVFITSLISRIYWLLLERYGFFVHNHGNESTKYK